jgi:hypothetical protein
VNNRDLITLVNILHDAYRVRVTPHHYFYITTTDKMMDASLAVMVKVGSVCALPLRN